MKDLGTRIFTDNSGFSQIIIKFILLYKDIHCVLNDYKEI